MRSKSLPIIIAVGIAMIAGSVIIGLAYSGNTNIMALLFNAAETSSFSSIGTAEAAALPMDVKEIFTSVERNGDAKDNPSRIKIDTEFIDPDEHCEFCYRIEIEPGAVGKLGAALKASKLYNLESAERVYLFARGQVGGEELQFDAAGKYVDGQVNGKAAKLMKFGYTSEKIKLKKDWQRYEMDLSNADLKDVSHGFGFDVATNLKSSNKPIVFYLKAITFDDLPAEKPVLAAAEAP
jgi:hypothetical protein